MSERLIDQLRNESEDFHSELEKKPEMWEDMEEVSEQVLPPKVSCLIRDFKTGKFNYEDYFQLSTEHRNLFQEYIRENIEVELSLDKTA